jgi:hypothetical protein
MPTSRFFALVTTVFLAATPCVFSACGPSTPPAPKTAAVTPGEMPPGGSWDGVYYNSVWGYLHIVSSGNTFEGRWLRTDESAWGSMKGTLTGDIAHFDWEEHTTGMVGPSATRSGKGYFRYARPEGDNVDDRVLGEWGFSDAEVGGGEWDSVKQRNKAPNLNSIGGEAEPTMGGWK